MTEQDLTVIKSRTLVLREHEKSSEIVLTDDVEGDMYFSFELMYIPDNAEGKVRYNPIDDFHAKIEIDAYPTAVTEMSKPAKIGTYQNDYPLYFSIVVEPQLEQSKSHNVLITFYKGKEGADGSNK